MIRLPSYSASLSIALFRVAGITPATATPDKGIYDVNAFDPYLTLKNFIKNPSTGLLHYLFILVGGAALIYIVWGGINYIQAGADTKKAGEARSAIINGVIGLAIAVGAYTIVSIGVGIGSTVNSLPSGAVNFSSLQYPNNGGSTNPTPSPTAQGNAKCINLTKKTECKPIANTCVVVTSSGKTNTACKDESGISCRCSETDVGCGSSNPCSAVTPACVCSNDQRKDCTASSDCQTAAKNPTPTATAATVDPNWGDSNDMP